MQSRPGCPRWPRPTGAYRPGAGSRRRWRSANRIRSRRGQRHCRRPRPAPHLGCWCRCRRRPRHGSGIGCSPWMENSTKTLNWTTRTTRRGWLWLGVPPQSCSRPQRYCANRPPPWTSCLAPRWRSPRRRSHRGRPPCCPARPRSCRSCRGRGSPRRHCRRPRWSLRGSGVGRIADVPANEIRAGFGFHAQGTFIVDPELQGCVVSGAKEVLGRTGAGIAGDLPILGCAAHQNPMDIVAIRIDGVTDLMNMLASSHFREACATYEAWRRTTERLFAGIATTSTESRPWWAAHSATASRSRTPQAGSQARR